MKSLNSGVPSDQVVFPRHTTFAFRACCLRLTDNNNCHWLRWGHGGRSSRRTRSFDGQVAVCSWPYWNRVVSGVETHHDVFCWPLNVFAPSLFGRWLIIFNYFAVSVVDRTANQLNTRWRKIIQHSIQNKCVVLKRCDISIFRYTLWHINIQTENDDQEAHCRARGCYHDYLCQWWKLQSPCHYYSYYIFAYSETTKAKWKQNKTREKWRQEYRRRKASPQVGRGAVNQTNQIFLWHKKGNETKEVTLIPSESCT